MKKLLAFCTAVALTVVILAGCDTQNTTTNNGKITVVTTLFPQYDFVRQIAGDYANIELLLPPGVESHTFDPSPADVMRIHKADVFLYTGLSMEAWAEKLIADLPSSVHVLNTSQGITLLKNPGGAHNHDHDDHTHTTDDASEYDPHIWTSPVNAKIMVSNILETLCTADPANEQAYRANAQRYLQQLTNLDSEIRAVVANGKRRELIFGSRFALFYFTHEYDLSYRSAFDSCSADAEPSAKTVATLIDTVKEEQIPVIYFEELTDPKIARSVSEETGAQMLLFHSCHNLSKEDFENGATYLSLMRQNVQNLEKGLE